MASTKTEAPKNGYKILSIVTPLFTGLTMMFAGMILTEVRKAHDLISAHQRSCADENKEVWMEIGEIKAILGRLPDDFPPERTDTRIKDLENRIHSLERQTYGSSYRRDN